MPHLLLGALAVLRLTSPDLSAAVLRAVARILRPPPPPPPRPGLRVPRELRRGREIGPLSLDVKKVTISACLRSNE